jgi:hypothetical protein
MGDDAIHVPKKKNPLKAVDFTQLCIQFENTIFEDLYNVLCTRYNIGRVRLMKSSPKTCLSWHRDASPRLHFPIKTQEGCFMIINDEVFHIPENTWYITPRTAMNAIKEDRIHLVVEILEDKWFAKDSL